MPYPGQRRESGVGKGRAGAWPPGVPGLSPPGTSLRNAVFGSHALRVGRAQTLPFTGGDLASAAVHSAFPGPCAHRALPPELPGPVPPPRGAFPDPAQSTDLSPHPRPPLTVADLVAGRLASPPPRPPFARMQLLQPLQQREGDHGGDLQERPGGGRLLRVLGLPALQVWCGAHGPGRASAGASDAGQGGRRWPHPGPLAARTLFHPHPCTRPCGSLRVFFEAASYSPLQSQLGASLGAWPRGLAGVLPLGLGFVRLPRASLSVPLSR